MLRCRQQLAGASRRRLAAPRIAAGASRSGCRHRAASSAAAAPLNTVVLLGSTRQKRIGSKVADYIVARLEERGGHAVTVLDPRSAGDGFLMEKAYFHYKPDGAGGRGERPTGSINL